jgi:hypothetical protein
LSGFVTLLRAYGVTMVTGDRYGGETFRAQFEADRVACFARVY